MTRHKKYLLIGFCFYIAMLIYFMFFGFGRPKLPEVLEYRYALIPVRIPLWFPKHFSITTLKLWIFALGNLLAFVPFGIFIPILFENHFSTYFKFVGLFLLFILSLEVIQMLTYLGSFDIEDIIVNTMGATIGFYSYKISKPSHGLTRKVAIIMLSIIVLSLIAFLIAWVFNNTITPYLISIYE